MEERVRKGGRPTSRETLERAQARDNRDPTTPHRRSHRPRAVDRTGPGPPPAATTVPPLPPSTAQALAVALGRRQQEPWWQPQPNTAPVYRRAVDHGPTGRVNGRARNERDWSCTRRGLLEERGRRQHRLGGPGRVNRRARNERDSSCTRRGLLEERGRRQHRLGGPGKVNRRARNERAGGTGRRQDKRRVNGWPRNEADSSALVAGRAAARTNGPRQ